MKIIYSLLCLSTLFLGSNLAFALEGESVVVSIKPIHSLVSAVMEGVGKPSLIVQGVGSEHVYSLRPSDAGIISHAKLIFWMSPEMENFLEKPFKTIGSGAKIIALENIDGLTKLKFREGGAFEIHKHEEETEDNHHPHEEYDLHFWLDPENAKILTHAIAKQLSEEDPKNSERYKQNAESYSERLDSLIKEVTSELKTIQNKPFIVFHDAYQYFEKRFGVNVVGSITISPEITPSAQRISEIHEKIKQIGAACVFSEPQFRPRLVQTVIEGTKAKSGALDPLGASLKDGPDLYPQLIHNLAKSLKLCLLQTN